MWEVASAVFAAIGVGALLFAGVVCIGCGHMVIRENNDRLAQIAFNVIAFVALVLAAWFLSSSRPVIPCPDDLRADTSKGRGWIACLDYGSNPPTVPEPAKPATP